MKKLWRKITKKDKKEEIIQKDVSTIEQNGYQLSSTSTSVIKKKSTTRRTEVYKSTTVTTFENPIPLQSNFTNYISLDAKPFDTNNLYKSSPPRSAFTSAPLTNRYNNLNQPRNYVNSRLTSNPLSTSLTVPSVLNSNTSQASAQANDEFRNKLVVNVTKSTKFYDDPAQCKEPVYRTRSKYRGKLLVINNMKFVNEKLIRKGAELDEENVLKLFNQMGFEIIKYKDLTKKDMENKIIHFRNSSSLKKVDIGAVIIMSHGTGKERSDSTEVACVDGELLQTTWIINQFDSVQCKNLMGKPKIFIFQCCRGESKDVQHDAVPITPIRSLSDMLIAYSTIPGFVSHRDPDRGTWYIQAICKVFMEHAHDTHVETLLKIVDHKLASLVADGSRQTSSFENRGFKTCYLHPQLSELM